MESKRWANLETKIALKQTNVKRTHMVDDGF